MSLLPKPTIEFSSQKTRYFHGEQVSGRIFFENPQPFPARFINVSCFGVTKTWGFKSADKRFTKWMFRHEKIEWFTPDGQNLLPAGSYSFPFSFQIPIYADPTFKGDYGKTEYIVKIEIDRPLKLNLVVKKEIRVYKKVIVKKADLESGYWKSFRFYPGVFVTQGVIDLSIKLSKLAVRPGETIQITAYVKNRSSKLITGIETTFDSFAHFHSTPLETPCDTGSECPLDQSRQKQSFETNSKILKLPLRVDPYSENSATFDYTIPKANVPTFRSPLISHNYKIAFRVAYKYLPSCYSMDYVVRVGKFIEAEEKEEMKERDKWKKKILVVVGAPPAYSENMVNFKEEVQFIN